MGGQIEVQVLRVVTKTELKLIKVDILLWSERVFVEVVGQRKLLGELLVFLDQFVDCPLVW
jgi:hypothetical protein